MVIEYWYNGGKWEIRVINESGKEVASGTATNRKQLFDVVYIFVKDFNTLEIVKR